MNLDKTLLARWCWDSESGRQFLIDLETGLIIAEKNEKGELVYAE